MSDAESPKPLSSHDKAKVRRRLLSGHEPITSLAKEYNRCITGLLREIEMPRRRRNRLSVAECRELSDHFHNSAFPLSRLTYGRLYGVSFEGVLQALEIARRSPFHHQINELLSSSSTPQRNAPCDISIGEKL